LRATKFLTLLIPVHGWQRRARNSPHARDRSLRASVGSVAARDKLSGAEKRRRVLETLAGAKIDSWNAVSQVQTLAGTTNSYKLTIKLARADSSARASLE
jgi:hypothetical protein